MAVENVKFKVILCGEYGSGKTSLFRRFIGASFEPNNDRIRSKGMDHSSRLFMHNGEQIMVRIIFQLFCIICFCVECSEVVVVMCCYSVRIVGHWRPRTLQHTFEQLLSKCQRCSFVLRAWQPWVVQCSAAAFVGSCRSYKDCQNLSLRKQERR